MSASIQNALKLLTSSSTLSTTHDYSQVFNAICGITSAGFKQDTQSITIASSALQTIASFILLVHESPSLYEKFIHGVQELLAAAVFSLTIYLYTADEACLQNTLMVCKVLYIISNIYNVILGASLGANLLNRAAGNTVGAAAAPNPAVPVGLVPPNQHPEVEHSDEENPHPSL